MFYFQTLLVIGYIDIYRDEKYFTNPNQFLPERWLNKDNKMHPLSFVPFGVGPRSCIGRRIAELEIICLISEVIISIFNFCIMSTLKNVRLIFFCCFKWELHEYASNLL